MYAGSLMYNKRPTILSERMPSLLADPSGFEPPISSVTGKRVRPLHHGSIKCLHTVSDYYSGVNIMNLKYNIHYTIF